MITLLGTVALGALAVAARKDIARELAENWLGSQGIPAEIRIDSLSLKKVSGRAILGRADAPDVVLDAFSVDYELGLFRAGQPLARVKQIRLVRPELVFSYNDKGLNLGTLQPFLERTTPSDQSAPPEIILIEDAKITAHTDYGSLQGTAQAKLTNGRLSTADIDLKLAQLNGTQAEGQLTAAKIKIRSQPDAQNGESLHILADIAADKLILAPNSTAPAQIDSLKADLEAHLPYRDTATALFDGPVKATLGLNAGRLAASGLDAEQLEARLSTEGTLADNLSTFTGQSQMTLRSGILHTGDIRTRDLTLSGEALNLQAKLTDTGYDLTATGPLKGSAADFVQSSLRLQNTQINLDGFDLTQSTDRTDIRFNGHTQTERLTQNDLTLNQLRATLDGEVHVTPEAGFNARIDADIRSPDARYTGLADAANKRASDLILSRETARATYERALLTATADTPPVPLPPENPDVMVSLSRALERFSLEAKGAHLTIDANGFDLSLKQPARLTPVSGGLITLTPAANRPLLSSQRTGALNLSISGGDLPETTARINDIALLANGAVKGRFTAQSHINFAPVYGTDLTMNGVFHYSPSGILIDLSDCIGLQAARADIGGRLTNVTGQICRVGAPLIQLTPDGHWQARGRFANLKADAPDYLAALSEGEGRFTARSLPDGLAFTVGLDKVRAADTLEVPRFNPLRLTGLK
ncbi:MAG: hypothetical protein QM645_11910, partial [Asticcacaulis sp.]